ncbi:Uncharacterized protein TCM_045214 [Theobroma cacao]|uniref:Uncharacterized protein n=1 Tax=Theobroma cacao TaxID=3641 RepID=A0A061FSZ9_THECC|nr:Uncharacterized protein TCM_045214 [Theobroma cacao]
MHGKGKMEVVCCRIVKDKGGFVLLVFEGGRRGCEADSETEKAYREWKRCSQILLCGSGTTGAIVIPTQE